MKNRTLRKTREQWGRILNYIYKTEGSICENPARPRLLQRAREKVNEFTNKAINSALYKKGLCGEKYRTNLGDTLTNLFFTKHPYASSMSENEYLNELLDNEHNQSFKHSYRKQMTKILDTNYQL